MEETTAFDCKVIEQEIAKTHSIQNEIVQTDRYDALVLGLVGDFSPGKRLAKHSATQKADARLNLLVRLKTAKCHWHKKQGQP